MPFEGQQCVVAVHPLAIIRNANQAPSAGFHLDADTRGAGVEGVLEQLLHDRSGTVDHLAGGDLIGHLVRKNSDAPHKGLG